MSVKGKVKRANKKIEELEKELEEIKSTSIPLSQVFTTHNRQKEEVEECKDNFIKMILNQRKPLEDSCCRYSISKEQLEMTRNARLEIERNYIYENRIDFILKV